MFQIAGESFLVRCTTSGYRPARSWVCRKSRGGFKHAACSHPRHRNRPFRPGRPQRRRAGARCQEAAGGAQGLCGIGGVPDLPPRALRCLEADPAQQDAAGRHRERRHLRHRNRRKDHPRGLRQDREEAQGPHRRDLHPQDRGDQIRHRQPVEAALPDRAGRRVLHHAHPVQHRYRPLGELPRARLAGAPLAEEVRRLPCHGRGSGRGHLRRAWGRLRDLPRAGVAPRGPAGQGDLREARDHHQPEQAHGRRGDADLRVLSQPRQGDQGEGRGLARRVSSRQGFGDLLSLDSRRRQAPLQHRAVQGPPPAVHRLEAVEACRQRRQLRQLPHGP